MQRRTLLSIICTVTLPLSGCTSRPDTVGPGNGTDETTGTVRSDDGTAQKTDLPEDCPTSQGLDVEWPDELNASAVEAFVEAYEAVYYRDVVVQYEPESQLDAYELSGSVTDGPRAVGNGWKLTYSGQGGIYRPTLWMGATTSSPPDGADLVPVSELDDEPLIDTLQTAAETGDAELHVDTPGEEVDRYVDRFRSLSDDFEQLSGPGDSEALYVAVDGTTVELTVQATSLHGDYWWKAWYYVDDHVVRRTTDDDTAARNGEVLECRPLGINRITERARNVRCMHSPAARDQDAGSRSVLQTEARVSTRYTTD